MSFISNIRKSAALVLILTATAGCVNEQFENDSPSDVHDGGSGSLMTKVINSPVDAEEGQLLICLDKESVSKLGNGEQIAALSPVGVDIKSFTPIFRQNGQNGKYLKKYGLDRWYKVEFEGAGLNLAAERFACFSEVEKIQFNTKVECGTDVRSSAPAESLAPSDDIPFNDPKLADQWHYINTGDKLIATAAEEGADIGVKDVWSRLTGGDNEIIVAILDGPVKYTHEDLKDNMWANTAEFNGTEGVDDDGNGFIDDIHGWNFERDTCQIDWTKDNESGHGTHVAGIVGAVNNNGIGVCGVAGGTGKGDGVRLMSCQIMEGGRASNASSAIMAFIYAADMGAHIAQCSFGYENGTFNSDYEYYRSYGLEYFAIQYFLDKERWAEVDKGRTKIIDGPLVIFASGNDGLDHSSYPGALMDCICVTGLGPDGYPAYYTNFGPGCNIAAPGGDYYLNPKTSRSQVMSTFVSEAKGADGDYAYMGGTSMACPHVSGVAALGLAYAKKLGKTFSREDFTTKLLTSVNDIDSRLSSGYKYRGYDEQTGGELPPRPYTSYQYNMGTGAIDAWRFMMSIEGTPCMTVKVGEEAAYSLDDFFGESSKNLTYQSVTMALTDQRALGIEKKPVIQHGRLLIHPTKAGSAKITVRAIAGGDSVAGTMSGDATGNGDYITIPNYSEDADGNVVIGNTGGMYITREISIISRGVASENGGWL